MFSWLGVDSDFVPPNLALRLGETPEVISRVRGLGLLHRFRNSIFWDNVGPHVPSGVCALGLRMSEQKLHPRKVETEAVKAYLRPRQGAETAALSELTGKDFPEWRALYEDA